MRSTLFSFCLSLLLGIFGPPALAQDAPDVLVKNVTNEVLTIIRTDQELQSGDLNKVFKLVDDKILPHFNFNRMTALAVGRSWREATPKQKEQLAAEFKTLLVRTYANALVSYKDQTIEVKPLRYSPSDTYVTVRTELKQPSGQSIQLDYSLQNVNSKWKVYDVVVAGASLVTNYRDTFSAEIRNKGIDGLILALATKNQQQPATNAAPK